MTQPYDLLHAYYETFNRRDVPYERLFAPDFMMTLNGVDAPPGLAPKRGFDAMWWAAIPDMRIENLRHVTDGNLVLVENRATGTQAGPLVFPDRTVPSLGRRVDVRFGAAFEVADGKITRQRMYLDRATLLAQLGAPLDAHVACVKSIYAAVPRGDVEHVLAQCTDDVSWGIESAVPAREVAPYGLRTGKAGVASFFADWASTVEFTAFDATDFIAVGDHVFNTLRYTIRVKATGKTFASPPLQQHWTFRGGKLARFRGSEDSAGTRDAFRP